MAIKAIKVFEPGTEEYNGLQQFAEKANKVLGTYGIQLVPEVTYFDYGQDWKWTTLIAHDSAGASWQALNPRQQGEILEGTNEKEILQDLMKFAEEHTQFQRTMMLKAL